MQQKIETAKGQVHAKVTVPGSKKITHRAILLAALADGVSELSGIQIGHHTKLLIDALRQVGIVIQLDEKAQSCIIAGGNGQFPKKQATIWCDNAKIITYFMMGACAGSQGVYYFDGSEEFRELNIENLLHLLRRQGAQIIPNEKEHLPFTLVSADTLEGGDVIFSKKENILAHLFLMIAPFARTPFNLSLMDLTHDDDIDLTCAIMAEFGVLVHRLHHSQLMVPVPQRYHARDYMIEPDFSLASYFFAAAAITGGEVTIQPIKRNVSKQTTIKILSVLEKMGCQIIERHYGLTVLGPKELKGIEISMREFSDAFYIVAALAPFASKPTYISHVGKISAKESERLKKMKNELCKLNIQVEAGDDWIKITPSKIKTPAVINSYQDPRLAMAFAVVGLKQPNIMIEDPECVTKNFPDFFTIWNKLAEPINVSA
jgi:3-phosphoshikimate 1-carboxyvinyltransferase